MKVALGQTGTEAVTGPGYSGRSAAMIQALSALSVIETPGRSTSVGYIPPSTAYVVWSAMFDGEPLIVERGTGPTTRRA